MHRQINNINAATAVPSNDIKMIFFKLKHVPRLHHQAQLAATTTCTSALFLAGSPAQQNLVTPKQKRNPAHFCTS